MQKLEKSLLTAENDLHAMQAEWRTLKGKESQLLDIGKGLEGAYGHVSTLMAAHYAASARKVTGKGNQRAAKAACDALLPDVTTA